CAWIDLRQRQQSGDRGLCCRRRDQAGIGAERESRFPVRFDAGVHSDPPELGQSTVSERTGQFERGPRTLLDGSPLRFWSLWRVSRLEGIPRLGATPERHLHSSVPELERQGFEVSSWLWIPGRQPPCWLSGWIPVTQSRELATAWVWRKPQRSH